MNVSIDRSNFFFQSDYLSLLDCIPSIQVQVPVVEKSSSSGNVYTVVMAVRIEGSLASFLAARQQQFLAAMQRASPAALNVTITKITEMSLGRRRLLAAYLDIGLEFVYGDEASAESAMESDLAESNLNVLVVGAGFGTLTVTTEPTLRPEGNGNLTLADDTSGSTPMWVIIVASVGGVVAVALIGVSAVLIDGYYGVCQTGSRMRCILKHENPLLEGKDLNDFVDAVLSRERKILESKFTEEARDIIMGKAKAAAEGLETLLCVDSKETFYRRISLEVAGIEEEMRQFVRERRRRSLVNDFPCLEEMSNKELEEVREIFHYIVHEGTSEKRYPNGIRDQGRPPGTRLIDFVSHPKAVDAGLSAAHVVALRMYTSSIYKYLNRPLRDQARKEKRVACALPVTTWYVCHSRR